ncbi:MAG: alpha/beta hydrolase [Acholeplasmataceae bacterium]|nr:alpha/beta hydrolase [Acholeplasmataceae bacterium]
MKTKSRFNKIIKRILLTIILIIVVLISGLAIYSSGSYQALPEMNDAIETLNLSQVTYSEKTFYIKYQVDDPILNIVFVPGGLVSPDSYKYLAASLAKEGYNVTIVKVIFNLAILTPNAARKYLDPNMDNVIIGHSLGGVVASMVASNNELISKIVLLGSYPIRDISSQQSLFITAEHDIAMDLDAFNDSLKYVNSENMIFNIDGGNHAQFGWYGPQKGDGEAEISTLEEQNIVINKILEFLIT